MGIIGCWSIENHGSNMTYYALYRYLVKMGYDVLMIERPNSAEWKANTIPNGFKKNPYPIYALSKIYDSKIEMKELNEICDIFLLGSDQLLYHDLYRGFDMYIDMSYIHANKKKLAYATSLGRKYFEGTDSQRARLAHFLQKFDCISVREQTTIDSLKEEFGIDSVWMPDPVFLLKKEEYEKIFEMNGKKNYDYIGIYILDPSNEIEDSLKKVEIRENLKLEVFTDVAHNENINNQYQLKYTVMASNEEWLESIKNCKYFITDSFHGTCFAIIFEKPFICIINERRGEERFYSLLEHFNLSDSMIKNICELPVKQFRRIDYAKIKEVIANDCLMAQQWLKKNLTFEKKSLSDFDIVDDKLDEVIVDNKRIFEITRDDREHLIAAETWLLNTHNRLDKTEEKIDEAAKTILENREHLTVAETWLLNTHNRLDEIEEKISRIEKKIDEVVKTILENREHLTATETWLLNTHNRLDRLEEKGSKHYLLRVINKIRFHFFVKK